MVSYPDEFWNSKPLSYAEATPSIKRWLNSVGASAYNTFDIRGHFSKNQIVLLDRVGGNASDGGNIITHLYVINGDFDVVGSEFRGGIISDFFHSQTQTIHSDNEYSKFLVRHVSVGSLVVDRSSLWQSLYNPFDKGYKVINYDIENDSAGSGSRVVYIGRDVIEGPVSFDNWDHITSSMTGDRFPSCYFDRKLGIDSPWIKSGFSSPDGSFETSFGPDTLTGKAKQKDIFSFSADPEFEPSVDKIINFSTKDRDILQFSKSAFGISDGTFVIAKTKKKLIKALATDVNIIYSQSKGELIFNANGSEAGFGDDGGVFALLVGAPKLTGSFVSFT